MYPIERTRTMYPIEVVPSALTVHNEWNVSCTHTASELEQRIPLNFIHALDQVKEETPCFRPENSRASRPCFQGTRCFRAVRDGFATEEEAQDLWQGLLPAYERPPDQKVGEKYMGIQANMFSDGLLANITGRMARFLEDEMGARGVRVSHTNSRGEWAFQNSLEEGIAAAVTRQAELRRGAFSRRHGHIDAARPIYWHYTCLLYVGPHSADQFAGGETLLIDAVDRARGQVRAGLLVEPRRGRLLAFSSGAENVHTALEATHGYRSLIQ